MLDTKVTLHLAYVKLTRKHRTNPNSHPFFKELKPRLLSRGYMYSIAHDMIELLI